MLTVNEQAGHADQVDYSAANIDGNTVAESQVINLNNVNQFQPSVQLHGQLIGKKLLSKLII